MSASVLGVPTIEQLKKVVDKLKKIRKAQWNGQAVTVESYDIDVIVPERKITIDATLKRGDETLKIAAVHYPFDETPDVITVNGADVDQDDVDLDLDKHWFRIDLEYRLEFEMGGKTQEVVLTASAGLG